MSKSTISTFELFQMFPDQESARLYFEAPLYASLYKDCRITGSLLLIDPVTNEAVALGVIEAVRSEISQPATEEELPVLRHLGRAFSGVGALPDVPKAEIVWRLHFMLGAVSYAIAGTDILKVITGHEISDISGQKLDTKSEAKRLSERLMPFLLGGLRAPLPHPSDSVS